MDNACFPLDHLCSQRPVSWQALRELPVSACNYMMMLVEHWGCRQTKVVAADLSEVVICGRLLAHPWRPARAAVCVPCHARRAQDCEAAAARGAAMQAWGVLVKVCKSHLV